MDTNVLVAGLRSRRGASHELLSRVDSGRFQLVLTVPLVLEYEGKGKELAAEMGLTTEDIDTVLDYLCSVGEHTRVSYLWRPLLRDVKDDMVLEAAVAGGCGAIITHNGADFAEAESFGIDVLTPGVFLRRIGER